MLRIRRQQDPVHPSFKAETYEFNGIASGLYWIPGHPEVFQIAQSELIRAVLNVESEQTVVHQSDRPELGNRLEDLATLLVNRDKCPLCMTL